MAKYSGHVSVPAVADMTVLSVIPVKFLSVARRAALAEERPALTCCPWPGARPDNHYPGPAVVSPHLVRVNALPVWVRSMRCRCRRPIRRSGRTTAANQATRPNNSGQLVQIAAGAKIDPSCVCCEVGSTDTLLLVLPTSQHKPAVGLPRPAAGRPRPAAGRSRPAAGRPRPGACSGLRACEPRSNPALPTASLRHPSRFLCQRRVTSAYC